MYDITKKDKEDILNGTVSGLIFQQHSNMEEIKSQFMLEKRHSKWCNGVKCLCPSCTDCKRIYIDMLEKSYYSVKLL